MRIGIDASPLRRYRSGVGHYAASLIEELARLYPDCEYLLLSHLTDMCIDRANLIRTQKHLFPIKEIWMQLWLPRILDRFRPDLCHFTNAIAPLRASTPYVVTIHDLSLILHPEWHPLSRRIWMRRLLRPSALRARGVLCDSEATRRDLLSWVNIDSSKVRVVPLGARSIFNQTCSEERKAAVRRKHGITKEFFLYLGNIEPRKNLPLLLKAFKKSELAEYELVLAGRRAWLWRDVLREISRLRLEARVRILDYLPEEELPALYQSARAFAYPSRMEGFGLPVLEAMASGVPVIVSRIEPLVSLVGDAGWLADPNDESEWQNALTEAARDQKRRKALAERARERAAPYTWESTARATMRFYEQVLGYARTGE